MIGRVCSGEKKEYVIGTEIGILYRMNRECPEKTCYPLDPRAVCINMKKTGLPDVLRSLETLSPVITVPEDIAGRARLAIGRMLDLP